MEENISLHPFNTFGINVKSRYAKKINHLKQIESIAALPMFTKNRLVIGGGSNILLTKDFDGLVLFNNLKGIEILEENDKEVLASFGAGEVWHNVVLFAINNNWGGIENLSLIPGKIGAAPMQNIGAYGVEIKDVFEYLKAWNIKTEQIEVIDKDSCNVGYRESVFKKSAKNKYIILSVALRLQKNAKINISYGAIEQTLKSQNIVNPSIKDVSNAIIQIRTSKLPNPKELGNAGSFFKNPVVDKIQVEKLLEQYPNLPFYPLKDNRVKLAAGWLIEEAGWKGKRIDNYGVHKNQALVLVNYGGAKGQDIYKLSEDIQEDILAKFNVKLEREVNVI